jgi:thiosulfate/3-mercaptopyruvate sulfurtransferase
MCAMAGYPNPQLLTTPADLARRLESREPPLALDLRPAEAFARGHVPHAIHIDLWGVSLIDTDPAPLQAFMWMIDHVLNLRGVDSGTPIVVYDEQSGARAARAFWFLEYFGHEHVQVLDGGFNRWAREGFPVSQDAETPRKSRWTGAPQASRIATWRDVQARLGKTDTVIVDTRSDDEYFGTNVRAKRGGAIPGAVHLEWTNNLGADGTFKPAAELREMYEKLGVTPDREVVTYCQGGYRAAHTYLALRLLGYPRVRNYTGSWKEWGDREDLPIEHPSRDHD